MAKKNSPDNLSYDSDDQRQDSHPHAHPHPHHSTHPHPHQSTHQSTHSHPHHSTHPSNISTAFFLNLAFTIIEFIGGLYTNSIAIITDAFHDLGDSISLGLAWYFERFSKKKRTSNYSYGFKRFSLIGAIVNSMVLIVGSIIMLREAIPRLMHPQSVKVEGMFLLAVLGIFFNGLAVFRMRKDKSINQRVVYLHLLEDVLGWVAVLIGALIMYFTNAPFIDPLLSIGIALYILYNAFKNIRLMVSIIMQGIPSDIDLQEIEEYFCGLPKITDFHDLHIWTMDGEYHVLTVHLVLEKELDQATLFELKSKIRKDLHNLNIEHATLEFESKDEDCVLVEC
ncbi:MAG: cation transporter [Saprospiraceae bacterium]|nr:cation transporter [Saprospiraceae bacterium]